MEDEYQVDETINSSEEQELEINPEGNEETEALRVKLAEAEEAKRQLTARAHKAEAENKAFKSKPVEAPQAPQASVEETVLLAQGMPEELVNELKAIAQVRNTTLLKAQNDPIFTTIKENFEKNQKQRDASLPASRGSGNVKPKKDFTTPGLTREEHMEMLKRQR